MFAVSNDRSLPEDVQDDSHESTNDDTGGTPSHGLLDPDTMKIHSRIELTSKPEAHCPTINVADLLGCTFISEPNENGVQMRARISGIETTKETSTDCSQRMHKFRVKVSNKTFKEIKTHNQMLDWVDRDLHRDDMYAFESIKAHRLHPDPSGDKKLGMDNAPKRVLPTPSGMGFRGDHMGQLEDHIR